MKKPLSCAGCPLHVKGCGFVLGDGDPKAAKIGILLEAPGQEEVLVSKPAVGPAGRIMEGWVLAAVGLHRKDVFVDNVLRCLPPKGKIGPYPTGDERKEAEAACRQYDRWDEFKPTVAIVTMHPAAILRETTPLPLVIADMKKAADFARAGERPIVLMGGKPATYWLGQELNVQKWRGHYAFETNYGTNVRARRLV